MWILCFALCLFFVHMGSASDMYCFHHSTGTLENCKRLYRKPMSAIALSKPNNTMHFDLNCHAKSEECVNVRATLEKAVEIISSVIQFETPLWVNATYSAFCQANCSHTAIGQAFPTISYLMTDRSDNVTRMYPQALLKQFTQLPTKPSWAHYDITAQFNSAVNWYFSNNPNPIKNNQNDFLRNVVHELIHGLGFLSAWSNTLYNSMSPLIDGLAPFATPMSMASIHRKPIENFEDPVPFWGFVEYPFDKWVYTATDDLSLSDLAQQLNRFEDGNRLFRNALDFANAWYTSGVYPVAVNLYQRMITQRGLWLKTSSNNHRLWLESSLNPFMPGSSLSHVDMSYCNTSDELMVYRLDRGGDVRARKPLIGPELGAVLASLGYRIQGFITPPTLLAYWSPSPNLAGTSTNPRPTLACKSGPAHTPRKTTTSSASLASFHPFLFLFITLFWKIFPSLI
ncbi:hypothetical protein BY458DRAFT_504887 [Sporodiniella umbellata]|nr:hypothetical protein BY458DRAFT_504887 [Sporodiniella umbellata]